METFRTEEEQVEALRRWWDENGKSTIVAIVIALSAGFGWQQWQSYEQQSIAGASIIYQNMLQGLNVESPSGDQQTKTTGLAMQLKTKYAGSTYAQFAALHLASLAVSDKNLTKAESELRWVLSRAEKGGDIAQVTELRLARVLAASGRAEQGLKILQGASADSYAASYAMARGDVLLQLGREDEASEAYTEAKSLAEADNGQSAGLATLEHKLQSLNPITPRSVDLPEPVAALAEPVVETNETDALAGEN